jgi:hypothetical protein
MVTKSETHEYVDFTCPQNKKILAFFGPYVVE